MSYSFSVTADTKAEAVEKIAGELDQIVASQPVHQADAKAAHDTAETFVNLLADPGEDECVRISVHGSLGWRGEGVFTNAAVGVNAVISPK